MVITFKQQIPSAREEEYKKQLVEQYNYGFCYYQHFYIYSQMTLVRGKVLTPLGPKDQKYPDSVFDVRARSRFAFAYNAFSFHPVSRTRGTVPPMTGRRSREWWYQNNPWAADKYFQYYCSKTMEYMSELYIPPWCQEPYFYIADTSNNTMSRVNTNTHAVAATVGSTGSGTSQFDSITDFTVDESFIYVCDSGNDRIKILNKVTLAYEGSIAAYGPSDFPIVSPTAICCDDKYIYFFLSGGETIKRIEKADYHSLVELKIKRRAGNPEPHVVSLENTFDTLYILDDNGQIISYFSKLSNSVMQKSGSDKTITQIVLDDEFLFCVDATYKKIIAAGLYYFSNVYEIGPGCLVDVPFDSVKTCCVSGDLLFAYDDDQQKIYTIDLISKTLLSTWEISGIFGSNLILKNEPQSKFDLVL